MLAFWVFLAKESNNHNYPRADCVCVSERGSGETEGERKGWRQGGREEEGGRERGRERNEY